MIKSPVHGKIHRKTIQNYASFLLKTIFQTFKKISKKNAKTPIQLQSLTEFFFFCKYRSMQKVC